MKNAVKLTPEADQFLGAATREFNEKQAALWKAWQLDQSNRYDFDQISGVLRLKFPDGKEFQADLQVLGSYRPATKAWEWAWNNPNVMKHVAKDSALVRELGEKFNIVYLTRGMISVPDEKFATYLAAIGLKATDSVGVYTGEGNGVKMYLALKNPRWTKKGDEP